MSESPQSHRFPLVTASLATARRFVDKFTHTLESRRKMQLFFVTLAAFAIALYVVTLERHAQQARNQWGDSTQVVLALHQLNDGDLLSDSNTRLVTFPRSLVALGALNSVVPGTHVVRAVGANAIVTNLDTEASTSAIPLGWRVVAFPLDLVTPELHAGDHVDVIASGTTIAHDVVVTVSPTNDRGAEIAVPSDVAALVAGAAANGDASLVIAN
jgi:hypothetical protein